MVSLKDRQALVVMADIDPRLKSIRLLLDGERALVAESDGEGLHGQLLRAIAAEDPARFREVAGELGQRTIKPDSDWCHDDYLLFLLLLGKVKFGCSLPFLAQVLEVRSKSANPVPRKINETFAALYRGEFGFEGDYGFLKIPFLSLLGKLRVGPTEAKRALQSMSDPGLFDQMSPFFRLLTEKAYDLVLLERQPIPAEAASELVEGFEKYAKEFSLHDWWRIFTALPGRYFWCLVVALVGSAPFLFGIGKALVDVHYPKQARSRPATIAVSAVREPSHELPAEALVLAKALTRPVGPEKQSLVCVVESAPFATATPAFVVEASHTDKVIRNAFAFVHDPSGGLRAFTVVPVQRDGGRVRALLTPQAPGQTINFILEMEAEVAQDVNNVGKGVVLRTLD